MCSTSSLVSGGGHWPRISPSSSWKPWTSHRRTITGGLDKIAGGTPFPFPPKWTNKCLLWRGKVTKIRGNGNPHFSWQLRANRDPFCCPKLHFFSENCAYLERQALAKMPTEYRGTVRHIVVVHLWWQNKRITNPLFFRHQRTSSLFDFKANRKPIFYANSQILSKSKINFMLSKVLETSCTTLHTITTNYIVRQTVDA